MDLDLTWAAVGVVVAALALSVLVGRPIAWFVLARVAREAPSGGVLRGGAWIGMLERLVITGSIIAGFPEGIAVVLAIKGLGRYPELREAHPDKRSPAAERFIIGTLVSFAWSGACGAVGVVVLHALP
ncbi:hypothetical protein [Georgenia wangjunii]|uniref:hypothetical protein n=1 Tax=Georgenia wangjunii TaxID=3117730 RepID=UPI002F25F42E